MLRIYDSIPATANTHGKAQTGNVSVVLVQDL